MKEKVRRALLAAVMVWMAGLGGCATPDAVRTFAGAAREAARGVLPVVADVRASCVRERVAGMEVEDFDDPAEKRLEACAAQAAAEPRLKAAVGVLAAYFEAMSKLAGEDAGSVGKQVDAVGASLVKAAPGAGPQIAPIQRLAKTAANLAGRGFQLRELSKVVAEADADIVEITTGLEKIVGEDYERGLRLEMDAVRDRHRDAVLEDGGKSKAVALLVRRSFAEAAERIEARRAAARSAAEALKAMREGHAKLAEAARRKGLKEIAGPLAGQTRALSEAIEGMRK